MVSVMVNSFDLQGRGKDGGGARPIGLAVSFVIQGPQLAAPARHIAQILHALPDRERRVGPRRQRTHDTDDHAQPSDRTCAQQLPLMPVHRGQEFRQPARADLITGDPQEPWRLRIERRIRGKGGDVVLGREVERADPASPQ